MKKCKCTDMIVCNGITAVIAEILYQEYRERGASDDGWDIEFIDTHGIYRHWKQYLDGGFLIEK